MSYQILHNAQLHPQSNVYLKLINPNLENGPWIAGGAALRWFNNKMVDTDVDVFVKTPEQVQKLQDILEKDNKYTLHYSTENALTYSNGLSPKIQIIVKQFYDLPVEVIDSFDITVCKFLIGSDLLFCSVDAITHNNAHQLHVTNINNPKAIFNRLLKYQFYGYTPDKETIELFEQNQDNINFTNIASYDY